MNPKGLKKNLSRPPVQKLGVTGTVPWEKGFEVT